MRVSASEPAFHERREGMAVAGFLPNLVGLRMATLAGGGPDIVRRGGNSGDGVGIHGVGVINGKRRAADLGTIFADQPEQVFTLRISSSSNWISYSGSSRRFRFSPATRAVSVPNGAGPGWW